MDYLTQRGVEKKAMWYECGLYSERTILVVGCSEQGACRALIPSSTTDEDLFLRPSKAGKQKGHWTSVAKWMKSRMESSYSCMHAGGGGGYLR